MSDEAKQRRAQRLVWSFETGVAIGVSIGVGFLAGPFIANTFGTLFGVVVVLAAASVMLEEAMRWQRRMRSTDNGVG